MTTYIEPLGGHIRQLAERLMVTYEHPLNEEIRLFLRLELLMGRFRYHVTDPKPENTVAALHLLLELYNLSLRLDVKSKILKEIDRLGQAVRLLMRSAPEQDVTRLDTVLERLNHHSSVLYQQRGQVGQHLKSHAFFNSLCQRASLPGGLNGFDIPLFHYWQEQSVDVRAADLEAWVAPYRMAEEAARTILEVIRDFGEGGEVLAKDGFFQFTLEYRKPYQLLRVSVPGNVDYYPEISAGKQRFTLRFVSADMLEDRGKQIHQDIPFKLDLCSF